jgi:hypothetical protein
VTASPAARRRSTTTDPTTRGAWLVKGEIEIGPQRRCVVCREWLPVERGVWVARPRFRSANRRGTRPGAKATDPRPKGPYYQDGWVYLQPCRACRIDLGLKAG